MPSEPERKRIIVAQRAVQIENHKLGASRVSRESEYDSEPLSMRIVTGTVQAKNGGVMKETCKHRLVGCFECADALATNEAIERAKELVLTRIGPDIEAAIKAAMDRTVKERIVVFQ